ncbi:MAG: DUF262 domain-containing protein [Muricauda sp.]|jgi:hypothetical protein|nr:DUF262 domain-containing protein [Allomuricauda sp.]MBO6531716.1 DUF262 domain-containing protein [Allomuricauda sp.]MBO6587605.1 DUF262 domain-containing protein [Allomuricauda sp.]MBO6617230.1 DUF262 domain-containing protein [Allomuricauda sp.]MBO6643759.1 DUF262 domain-containing protein [Allomuricauda sp.]MBO6745565.1 DUF262 domain-containing protein [Allomuricauda sp.]
MEELLQQIESRRTSFKTDGYSMSIGELVNLYENDEIIIRPEYQRLFRWTHGQKVKLVESIILGIPVPSIFVYQDENGIWELVDGLQRVSTILQLFGVLKDEEPLVLEGTKHIPSLEGFKWENNDKQKELPQGLKLAIKRAKINLTIILSDSDKRAKFEVFQRLNTGGSNASNQEVRNNVMLMVKPEVFTWFNELATNPDFLETLSLSDRLYDEQYHMELLLRFIALAHYEYNHKKDVGDYLDDINEDLLNNTTIDFDSIKTNFESTFATLNQILGEKSFKKYNGTDFKGKFLESSYEAVSIGLASNIEKYNLPLENGLILDKIKGLYNEEVYIQTSGSGSNAKNRIPKLVPFAKDYFSK